jgi:hypothetical protein
MRGGPPHDPIGIAPGPTYTSLPLQHRVEGGNGRDHQVRNWRESCAVTSLRPANESSSGTPPGTPGGISCFYRG